MTDESSTGLRTLASRYAVAQTIARFEDAVRERGGTIFASIDHAAAAAKAGIAMRARTVIIFGNPAKGTALMQQAPTFAIDLPFKALVWEDDAGQVYLTVNTGEYLRTYLRARHGLSPVVDSGGFMDQTLDAACRHATAQEPVR